MSLASLKTYVAGRLLIDVYVDRFPWAITAEGRTIASGVCLTYGELAAIQKEHGVACIIIDDGFRTNEVRDAAKRHGWLTVRGLADTPVERSKLYDEIRDAIEAEPLQS